MSSKAIDRGLSFANRVELPGHLHEPLPIAICTLSRGPQPLADAAAGAAQCPIHDAGELQVRALSSTALP